MTKRIALIEKWRGRYGNRALPYRQHYDRLRQGRLSFLSAGARRRRS